MRRSPLQRRTPLARAGGPKRRTPLGHASPGQKAKVEREGARLEPFAPPPYEVVDAAHVTPRAIGGCDHEDCVIGLRRADHRMYDAGRLDILPYLTLAEQAHAVSHLGILGALRRTTGDNYVVEGES